MWKWAGDSRNKRQMISGGQTTERPTDRRKSSNIYLRNTQLPFRRIKSEVLHLVLLLQPVLSLLVHKFWSFTGDMGSLGVEFKGTRSLKKYRIGIHLEVL